MIRKETLCSASQWQQPTPEEITEVMNKINYTDIELSELLGVNVATVKRWKNGRVEIRYAEWATLCYLAGLGDIWESDDTFRKIQNKVNRAKQNFLTYSQKLKQREKLVLNSDN